MATSPTQRSLAHLRREGYTLVQVVEKWIPRARRRVDLFGIIDVVGIHEEIPGLVGIQATSISNFSSRVRKAQESTSLPIWIQNGNRFEVHGWGKKGPRGKRKTWQLKKADYDEVCLYGRGDPGDNQEATATPDGPEIHPDHEREGEA